MGFMFFKKETEFRLVKKTFCPYRNFFDRVGAPALNFTWFLALAVRRNFSR
jgi:hypothetical protein